MPKLLSEQEVQNIAASMTEAYGLPPPRIINENRYSDSWSVRVEIVKTMSVRKYKHFRWPTKQDLVKVKDFYSENFEDALVKLKYELSKFDARAKIAEEYRETYAMIEATEVLDKVLSE